LTGNSPHEDSPLDSLILTQYERNDETTSSEFNQDKGTKLVVDECQNEDMVEGGYGLEESKEGLYEFYFVISIIQRCIMISTIGIYLEVNRMLSGG
jgi:hypothetical protein